MFQGRAILSNVLINSFNPPPTHPPSQKCLNYAVCLFIDDRVSQRRFQWAREAQHFDLAILADWSIEDLVIHLLPV